MPTRRLPGRHGRPDRRSTSSCTSSSSRAGCRSASRATSTSTRTSSSTARSRTRSRTRASSASMTGRRARGLRDGGETDLPATWLTLLTSIFMHGGLLHLGGNMLFLWVFGNNIEDAMGRSSSCSSTCSAGWRPRCRTRSIDTDSTIPSIGASGAVAAVLGGYALLYPRARVVTLIILIVFITVIELPALLILGLWFLFQLYRRKPADRRRGRRGGVLRAHRRLPLRPGHYQAVRAPREPQLRLLQPAARGSIDRTERRTPRPRSC